MNSINWARVVAQMVYYFTSAVALGAPFRQVSFAVPTGNFGDVLAGYVGEAHGPADPGSIVATNVNDILARALASGRYEPRGVTPTQSPSMDIQLSSNFERLLFDALGRDPAALRAAFASLDQSGGFDTRERPGVDPRRIRRDGGRRGRDQRGDRPRLSRIRLCARSAHGHRRARGARAARGRSVDPGGGPGDRASAKFPAAIERAIGVHVGLPPRLAPILDAPERFTQIENDAGRVRAFIDNHARASRIATRV